MPVLIYISVANIEDNLGGLLQNKGIEIKKSNLVSLIIRITSAWFPAYLTENCLLGVCSVLVLLKDGGEQLNWKDKLL